MRIPDDIEDLVFAFMDADKKKGLMRMTRDEIDDLIMAELGCAIKPGYIEAIKDGTGFPYKVTDRGKEILKILSPCKRSGR